MKKISKDELKKIFLEKESSKEESNQEDINFLEVMKNVKPLPENKQADFFTYKKLRIESSPSFSFTEDISHNFKISQLSKKEILQIKKINQPIATLDLHGKTTAESSILLDNFIKNCFNRGLRLAIVITGKGNNSAEKENGIGILKAFFLEWLQRGIASQYVVSYSEASPIHGGSGAFYVCLRKNRNL
ncbi:MAG: Smr/MutS family protein [Alphaproteobacteria bacterium]|nr:Smr/MutS family protein [Alphaproteobacteria bacterium]